MATTFPTALDNFTNPAGTDILGSTTVPHSTQHSNLNDAVEALEVAVGITNSADTNSLQYRTDNAVHANGIILGKDSGVGVKVDVVTPTFGWRDMLGDISVKGAGASDPTFAVYTGTVMRQHQFSATVEQEVFIVYHMPHDYVPGTQIYFHAHWSNAAAAPNTGNVVWGFDYSFAKGFNQAPFPAFTSITVTQASPATRYQHNIAETVGITIAALEVDGLLLVRGYRKAADAGDTCTDAVFLHTMDIHYQSTNMATKQKAPNFYT
jgi:hypothetical protein